MIEMLNEFADRFEAGVRGYQGWFVSADGDTLIAADLKSEGLMEYYGKCRDLIFLEPGLLFFSEDDGSFDLDRIPDFFAVPATQLGTEMLEAARKVAQLEEKGDELQDDYMATLDHFWSIDRRCRGMETRNTFEGAVTSLGEEFNAHRTAEKAARVELYSLLTRFKHGEESEVVETPSLALPENHDGEDYSEEGEGYPLN